MGYRQGRWRLASRPRSNCGRSEGARRQAVSRTAWYPARNGIPHGMVSRTAWYPARHGILQGMRTVQSPLAAEGKDRIGSAKSRLDTTLGNADRHRRDTLRRALVVGRVSRHPARGDPTLTSSAKRRPCGRTALPHLRRDWARPPTCWDWAHPCQICAGTGPAPATSSPGRWTGLTPPTSAPGRWTGLTPPTSAPGLGSGEARRTRPAR